MSLNKPYRDVDALPGVIPLFPLPRALLLPRGELPLNIFEPRYVAMFDDALGAHRLIGMIQPLPEENDVEPCQLSAVGCAGRITRLSETGDGRYSVTLTGIARFRVIEELDVSTPYRQCKVDWTDYAADLDAGAGENAVDRAGVVAMLRAFAESTRLEIDWASIDAAPTETLVNALAMMCPYGFTEKQALLEAATLKARAEILVALAELDMAQQGARRSQFH